MGIYEMDPLRDVDHTAARAASTSSFECFPGLAIGGRASGRASLDGLGTRFARFPHSHPRP